MVLIVFAVHRSGIWVAHDWPTFRTTVASTATLDLHMLEARTTGSTLHTTCSIFTTHFLVVLTLSYLARQGITVDCYGRRRQSN